MFDFIRNHQMNIMLALCAVCATMAVLLLLTRFLPKKRKWILIGMELSATLLLFFDRLGYQYGGNPGSLGYVLVRLSNFGVFFITSGIVFLFNLYLIDLLSRKASVSYIPKRLNFVTITSSIGMLLSVVTVFTGLYYSFDSNNVYHRGKYFLISYIIPVICPIIQFTVITEYRKSFSRFIYTALLLYIFLPISMGILQIFAYGISIVNMAMVLVSISLYIFTYLDINDEVQKAHSHEMNLLREEQNSMKQLFAQTTDAFIKALEKRSSYLTGYSKKVAKLSRLIAEKAGKSEAVCEEAYYTGLLHNVALGSIPDSLIQKESGISEDEEKIIKKLPESSSEILSSIKQYPYLSENIRYIHERYDGKGYPKGLKGEEIPELSRIVAISQAYVSMDSKTPIRNPIPKAIIREELVKESGLKYDPVFAETMVLIMDAENSEIHEEHFDPLEKEISCTEYRSKISVGIPVTRDFTEISFDFTPLPQNEGSFSAPSLVLFDSYDRHVHSEQNLIESYSYLEYAELWFDGHYICTSARNLEAKVSPKEDSENQTTYKVSAARFEDHLLVKLNAPEKLTEVIIALPDISKSAYIGITGENCQITNISAIETNNQIAENGIPRIAEKLTYINRLESDIPNVQINSPRASYTQGVNITDKTKIFFHTMSLPGANLVWHCPYIVLYYSDDKKIGGKNYREYAMIKFNGEDDGSKEFSENSFTMKKLDSFKNWTDWKEANKAGYESIIELSKKGNVVHLLTINHGIYIENTCIVKDNPPAVYVALTGDQCALTDIRIK
ncbi:MAG: HD domain-containing protein [Treponema sp.]|nr:HD domain-containing protein [Treponema sp.]